MLSKFSFLSAPGGFAPDQGSAPGPRWGLRPQTPVIGSRSSLAMSSPTVQKTSPPLLCAAVRWAACFDVALYLEDEDEASVMRLLGRCVCAKNLYLNTSTAVQIEFQNINS